MKQLPVSAGREIAKKYKQDQVIIVTWEKDTGRMHTVSYGSNETQCEQAAEAISFVRRVLGFPESECQSKEVFPKMGLNSGKKTGK